MDGCATSPTKYGVKRAEDVKERICLSLTHSDPGRILALIRSLYENSAAIIQMKVNRYLADVTGSDVTFMIMSFQRKNEHRINVIGERILPLEMYISAKSEMILQCIKEKGNSTELFKDNLTDELIEAIESYISKTDKYGLIHEELTGLLVVPIKHPISDKTLLYVVLVHPKKIVDYKRITTGLVHECMRYCQGIIVNSVSFEVEKIEHERARNFIEIMRQVLLTIEQTSEIIDQIRLCICDLMEAERCAIFLKDKCGNLVTKILDYGERFELAEQPLKDVILPNDFGLLGIVAQNGDIINCIDAQNDKRYCDDLDRKIGATTYTVLCFPLRLDSGEIVGVVEVYNKVHSVKTLVFTDGDVLVAEALGVLLPPVIFHSLNFKKMQENLDRRTASDDLYLKKNQPSAEDVERVSQCEVVHDYYEIMHLNYSQFKLDDSHLGCVVYDFFNKFGLVRRFDIRPGVLIKFILSIFHDHPNFPFHNWLHTYGTFHFSSILVNDLNLVFEGFCTHIEVLALLLAALCHCSDYRGALSPFQISCGGTLAALYSSPAHINQQFQSTQIFRLLNRTDTNILENITSEQYRIFALLFKKLINASDLGHFTENLEKMETTLKGPEELDFRICLLSLIMVCSVVNDYSKDFLHCRRIAEMSFAEYLPNMERPHAQGVFNMSQFSSNVELVPHLQIQFINTICIPAFKLLSEIFPMTYPCLDRCQNNLATWEKYKDKFQQILDEELAAQALAEHELAEQE